MSKKDPVIARWSVNGLFYPGKIAEQLRKNAYAIKFDDGEKSTVTVKNIFRLNLEKEEELIDEYERREEKLNDEHIKHVEKLNTQYERREEKIIDKHRKQIDSDEKVRELRRTLRSLERALQEERELNARLQTRLRKMLKEQEEAQQRRPADIRRTLVVPGD